MFNLNLESLNEGNIKSMDKSTLYDSIVIGGGPAAISSAIYLARKGLKVGVIALNIGGQILDTNEIENIIGTTKITGHEFSEKLEKHLKEYEVSLLKGHLAKSIKQEGNKKIVVLDDGQEFTTKTVIVSTGAKWRKLNVEGEDEYIGKGVHYCSTCDGPFYKNLDVVVVGGGNSGVEAALDLAAFTKNVTLIEYLPELKADSVLQEKLKQKENVKVILNSATEKIKGEQFVEKIIYKTREDETIHELKTDGIFVEIGLTANSDFVKDLVEVNKFGEIIIDDYNMTSVDGIFAAGDCTNIKHKQIIISMGEGAKAALSVFEYILKN